MSLKEKTSKAYMILFARQGVQDRYLMTGCNKP